MRVLLTGQVGLNKGHYITSLKNLAAEKGIRINSATVGSRMIQSHPHDIDDRTILNIPRAMLDLLRRYAWSEIVEEAEESEREDPDSVFIVNGHAVFRWHHGLFPALDLDLVIELQPDVLVTLIDDVDRVVGGLQERHTDWFKLWEVLAWREEEIWFTKFLGDSLRKLNGQAVDFFVLPKEQGPQLLLQILTKPDAPKVYMSFPVSGVPPDQKQKIQAFKERVSQEFVGFDPLALGERSLVTAAHSLTREVNEHFEGMFATGLFDMNDKTKLRWRPCRDEWSSFGLINLDMEDLSLEGREVIGVLDAIDSQIIARDHLLIDQSDFVLMYVRAGEEGVPLISAGCQSEMIYAYSQGKPAYVVFPGKRTLLSPWVTQYSEVFQTLQESFEHLATEYGISGES
jgi:adenylate kinase